MELQLTGTKAGGGAGASSGGSTSAPTKAGLDIGAAAFMLKEQADTPLADENVAHKAALEEELKNAPEEEEAAAAE